MGREVIHFSRGIKKAAVFPDPVSATPMMSLFCRPMGMACLWIGVGSCKRAVLIQTQDFFCFQNAECISRVRGCYILILLVRISWNSKLFCGVWINVLVCQKMKYTVYIYFTSICICYRVGFFSHSQLLKKFTQNNNIISLKLFSLINPIFHSSMTRMKGAKIKQRQYFPWLQFLDIPILEYWASLQLYIPFQSF